MRWRPPAETDATVRVWMRGKGWKVEGTEWDARKETYVWISYPGRTGPIVLGMSRDVIDQLPAFAIQEVLERQNASAELRSRPGVARVLVRRADGYVLEELSGSES